MCWKSCPSPVFRCDGRSRMSRGVVHAESVEWTAVRLLPVLDVLGTVAVRGVGGRRNEYQPLISQVATGSDPRVIAQGYRACLRTAELYLADLDAIVHQRQNPLLIQELIAAGTQLWLDVGLRTLEDLATVPVGVKHSLIGLETWTDPKTLPAAVTQIGTERLVFSVDLRGGQSCGGPAWPPDPEGVIETVLAAGCQQVLILDLADVGTSTGGSTQSLCRWLRRQAPAVTLIAGGGVRGPDDVTRWENLGVDWLLVGSAVHDGRLGDARQ